MSPSSARIRQAQTGLLITFLLVGHATLSSVAWVPEYIDRLGVSFAAWGTILGFSTMGAIIPLMFASRVIHRYGSRAVMRLGLYAGMVFLVLLGWTNDPVLWTLVNTMFTFSMSFAGNAVNTHAVAIQAFVAKPIVSTLHAGWSIGAVFAALSGALSTVLISLEVFLIAVAVVTLVLFEILRPRLLSADEDGHEADRSVHVKRRFWQMPREMWILTAGLIASVYPEIAIVDWAAVFARDVLGAELSLRALPFAAFMAGMIIGRLSITRLAEYFHPHTIASRGSLFAAIALTGSVLFSGTLAEIDPGLGLAVTGVLWLLVGLGLSSVAPTYFAAAAHVPQVSTAWALSRMQLINQLALIGAKALMGALAEGFSLSAAFVFPVVLLIIGSVIMAKATRRAESADYEAISTTTGTITLPVIRDEE